MKILGFTSQEPPDPVYASGPTHKLNQFKIKSELCLVLIKLFMISWYTDVVYRQIPARVLRVQLYLDKLSHLVQYCWDGLLLLLIQDESGTCFFIIIIFRYCSGPPLLPIFLCTPSFLNIPLYTLISQYSSLPPNIPISFCTPLYPNIALYPLISQYSSIPPHLLIFLYTSSALNIPLYTLIFQYCSVPSNIPIFFRTPYLLIFLCPRHLPIFLITP